MGEKVSEENEVSKILTEKKKEFHIPVKPGSNIYHHLDF